MIQSKQRLLLSFAICFFVFAASLIFAMDIADFEKKISYYELENGLRVLIFQNRTAPVVSFVTYVNAGSVNEVVGTTGLAHMLEHMAFKGTNTFGTKDWLKEKPLIEKIDSIYADLADEKQKINPDQEKIKKLEAEFSKTQEQLNELVDQAGFMKVLEQEGAANFNAGTGFDSTIYIVSLPANKIQLWAMMEADRFKNGVFREFYKERDVVIEERRLRVDSTPFGRILEEFLAICYKAHPYGILTIGHMSDIQNMTRQVLRDFFNKYYVPSNMILSVAGDVDPEQMIQYIKKYWSDMPKKPHPSPVITVEPEQIGEKTMTIYESTQPILIIGYHKPDFNNEDSPAVSALLNIMANGRTSRLYTKLVKEQKIAIVVFAFADLPGKKYPGLIIVAGIPAKDITAAKLRDAIFEEIEKIKTDGVTEADLKKVQTQTKANIIRSLDSNLGMAMALAEYQVTTGDWRNLFREIEKIEAVTVDDVKRVANKYLTVKNRNIAMIETKPEETEK